MKDDECEASDVSNSSVDLRVLCGFLSFNLC
jgi:hypothetical protein